VRAIRPSGRAIEAAGSLQPRPTGLLERTTWKQSAEPLLKTKVATTKETHYRRETGGQNLLDKFPKLGLACQLDSRTKTSFDWSGLDSWFGSLILSN
jgi:hypothetical protein